MPIVFWPLSSPSTKLMPSLHRIIYVRPPSSRHNHHVPSHAFTVFGKDSDRNNLSFINFHKYTVILAASLKRESSNQLQVILELQCMLLLSHWQDGIVNRYIQGTQLSMLGGLRGITITLMQENFENKIPGDWIFHQTMLCDLLYRVLRTPCAIVGTPFFQCLCEISHFNMTVKNEMITKLIMPNAFYSTK